jgi:hypothetical protein
LVQRRVPFVFAEISVKTFYIRAFTEYRLIIEDIEKGAAVPPDTKPTSASGAQASSARQHRLSRPLACNSCSPKYHIRGYKM